MLKDDQTYKTWFKMRGCANCRSTQF